MLRLRSWWWPPVSRSSRWASWWTPYFYGVAVTRQIDVAPAEMRRGGEVSPDAGANIYGKEDSSGYLKYSGGTRNIRCARLRKNTHDSERRFPLFSSAGNRIYG